MIGKIESGRNALKAGAHLSRTAIANKHKLELRDVLRCFSHT
jgi:hypothetical protein